MALPLTLTWRSEPPSLRYGPTPNPHLAKRAAQRAVRHRCLVGADAKGHARAHLVRGRLRLKLGLTAAMLTARSNSSGYVRSTAVRPATAPERELTWFGS